MKKSVITKILALVCVLFFVLSVAGCSKKTDAADSDKTETTESVSATAPAETESVTEMTASAVSLKEYYEPYKAFDADGTEVDLSNVYGSAYREYGGSLTFTEENSFNLSVGINNGKTFGTYVIAGEKEIVLNYAHGDTKVIFITGEENGVATEIKVPTSDYLVYFR